MSKYSEMFKDPRWQKKRLEIFNRDGFRCQICGDYNVTLHVHHKYYINNNYPWDYDDSCLVTLCENCQEGETKFIKYEGSDLIFMLKKIGFMSIDLGILKSYLSLIIEREGGTPEDLLSFLKRK